MTAAIATAMKNKHEIRCERPKPTLDVQHLAKLAEESSREVAEAFVTDYTALLPQRVDRIVRTVTVRDQDLAMDASLSLKTTSWLAGALRMNQLCRELELALALSDAAAVASLVRDIEQHLPRLQEALAGRARNVPTVPEQRFAPEGPGVHRTTESNLDDLTPSAEIAADKITHATRSFFNS